MIELLAHGLGRLASVHCLIELYGHARYSYPSLIVHWVLDYPTSDRGVPLTELVRIGGENLLFFGDIGDNPGTRPSVQVYIVREPTRPGKALGPSILDLRYPDGPHNAETLLVDPKTGQVTIVTKTAKGPSKIFVAPPGRRYVSGSGRPTAPDLLKEVGAVRLGAGIDASKLVTGGDYSEDGRYVVLRTYLAAYEFDVPEDGAWWRSKPRPIRTAFEVQGEAIAYAADGTRLVTTSEYAPCPVSVIPIGRS